MRELDKSKVYDLSELTSEEYKELMFVFGLNQNLRVKNLIHIHEAGWVLGIAADKTELTNAKELFYTLENIQVDCSELSRGTIEEMAKFFEASGLDTVGVYNSGTQTFLRKGDKKVSVLNADNDKTTITYEKFMELFRGTKESEAKPAHYSKGIDTFARMESNCTKEECLAFAKGNIDKYNWRNKGQDVEDLKKIIQYANWALKIHENGKEK